MPKRNWFKHNSFTIAIICSIIFLLIVILFRDKINKALEGKEDFFIGHKYKSIQTKKKKENKTENRCREIFENIFKKPFPTTRPDFLRRSNGYALELDGYNSQLKLAFEYNGQQHYNFVPKFHKNPDDLKEQKVRDNHKKFMCKQAGVTLITIPYTVKWDNLESYIRSKLGQLIINQNGV